MVLLPKLIVPPLTLLITIVDVPALNVRPVDVAQAMLLEVLNVTVDDPRLIVRVLELLDDRDDAVTLKLLVVKVPFVIVIVPEETNASCSVYVPPVAKNSVFGSVFPAVVMLKVEAP